MTEPGSVDTPALTDRELKREVLARAVDVVATWPNGERVRVRLTTSEAGELLARDGGETRPR